MAKLRYGTLGVLKKFIIPEEQKTQVISMTDEETYTGTLEEYIQELIGVKPVFDMNPETEKFLKGDSHENPKNVTIFGRNKILQVNRLLENWWDPKSLIIGSNPDFTIVYCIGPESTIGVFREVSRKTLCLTSNLGTIKNVF